MLKITLHYDLPAYDPKNTIQINPLDFTYRGVHYAKWVNINPLASQVGKYSREVKKPLFFCLNVNNLQLYITIP